MAPANGGVSTGNIADLPLSNVSEEEKRQYVVKVREVGLFRGYKMRQFFVSVLSLSCALPPEAVLKVRTITHTAHRQWRS